MPVRLCRKEGKNKKKRGRKEGALKPPSKRKKNEVVFKIRKKRGRKDGIFCQFQNISCKSLLKNENQEKPKYCLKIKKKEGGQRA